MKGDLLLDTQVLLWWGVGDRRLGAFARDQIETTRTVVLSDVSMWEMAIKVRIGKLSFEPDLDSWFATALARQQVLPLQISRRHIARTARLPLHHRDPFDRLLIAQAQVERLTVVTVDHDFRDYDVDVLDAAT